MWFIYKFNNNYSVELMYDLSKVLFRDLIQLLEMYKLFRLNWDFYLEVIPIRVYLYRKLTGLN